MWRKNNSSCKADKATVAADIEQSHVEGRDDYDEHKHVDIDNDSKRERIQLDTANTKWGLHCCTKRAIRQIIIAIVTMRIVCSHFMSFQSPLSEVSVSAEEEESTSSLSLDTRSISNIPVHNRYRNDNVCESIIFGTHHKTGTVLAKRLLKTMCPNFTTLKNFNMHMKPDNYIPGSPFVHFVRDPLEQVIVSTIYNLVFPSNICKFTAHNIYLLQSAYQYHRVTTEKWAIVPGGLQDILLNTTVEDGLEIQFNHSKGVLKEMEDTYMFTMNLQSRVFTIRIDDIVERDMFRLTMTILLRWLGLSESVTVDSLEACCFVSEKDRSDGTKKHVSKGSEKLKMRQIVMLKHAQEITEIRKRMDFPLVGLEQSDADSY